MRHPFAGIILREGELQSEVEQADAQQPSRRTALKVMLAGVGATLTTGASFAQADETDGAASHSAYLVVPRDFRTFRAERRHKLGVLGDYYRGPNDSKNLRGKSGFLAWLTSEEEKQVAAASEVAEVLPVSADDKAGPGKRQAVAKELRLHVVPGGWKPQPEAATFTATEKLIGQWSKQFALLKDVSLKPGADNASVVVEVGEGEPPAELIARLKEHPQVMAVDWKYLAVTTRVGEDGGVTTRALGEEGGPTTTAVREEGATTLALGEEGGTTRRVGEEGGVTTKALGEEGGGSTERLGEEGGGGPTTQALGEEGGGSTRRLGEEGGGGFTTQALGEEGGDKKPTPKAPKK
jgi:hypothetical protein